MFLNPLHVISGFTNELAGFYRLYRSIARVWTKRGVGHGASHGLPCGLPYGPPYGLTVVNFFLKTRRSIAVNLCKPRVLHQSVISTALFSPLGGVSL